MSEARRIATVESLNTRGKRLNLQQMMADFIAFLEDDDYTFAEIVGAFSNFALDEIGKMPCEKPSWEIASAVLKLSANKIMIILSRPSVREGCQYLRKSVAEFLETLQGEEYAFGEILLALVFYVEGKKRIDTSQKSAWGEVVTLLELAALQAQVEGRELP